MGNLKLIQEASDNIPDIHLHFYQPHQAPKTLQRYQVHPYVMMVESKVAICCCTALPIYLITPSHITVFNASFWTNVFERIAISTQGAKELQLHTSGYHRAKHNNSLLAFDRSSIPC